jgi:predicted nucleotidyltransferase
VAAFPKQWELLRLKRDEARSTVQLRSSITNRPSRYCG